MDGRIVMVLALGSLSLAGCNRMTDASSHASPQESEVRVYDLVWTSNAAQETVALMKRGQLKYELPQLRVYDAAGQLVYVLKAPWNAKSVGAEIDQAIKAASPVEGPGLQQSLAQLQSRDGKMGTATVAGKGKMTLVDYWASWCAPCKVLEGELRRYAAAKDPGSVQIVRAETDIMKAMQASGQKVTMMTKDEHGRLVKKTTP